MILSPQLNFLEIVDNRTVNLSLPKISIEPELTIQGGTTGHKTTIWPSDGNFLISAKSSEELETHRENHTKEQVASPSIVALGGFVEEQDPLDFEIPASNGLSHHLVSSFQSMAIEVGDIDSLLSLGVLFATIERRNKQGCRHI
ncbi:hypothetical protein TWF225_003162 [Orbilia oligospora]|nr:hypothetical protein TWF225_003162 [Orbilia oligospora]KAF3231762.1 hypothetical protein TWF128_004503 [Orbilia oligospora]KAF3234299.1 hypothetical protein TWF217_003781 [Orbilia oligospora]